MKTQPFAAVPAFVLVTLVLNLALGVVPCKAAAGIAIDPDIKHEYIEEREEIPLPHFPKPPKKEKTSNADFVDNFNSSCSDSPLKVLTSKNLKSAKTCAAIAKKRKKLCKKNTIKSHCPSTCETCDTFGTADSTGKFMFENEKRDCTSWLRGFVTSFELDEVSRLCEIDSIRETCRHTCSYFWCPGERSCGEKITSILESTLGLGEVISGSPQEAALEWIIGDISGENCDNLDEAILVQRFALAVVYYSTGGDGWTDNTRWLSSDDECSWYGLSCSNDDDKALIEMDLDGNNLSGTIPDEIKALDSLEYLSLYSNSEVSGTLPESIGALTNLTYLDLSNMSLTGPIPDLSGLINLKNLYFENNDLTGSISDQFDGMTSLGYISLYSNGLTGPVPDLSGLTSLEYLYAYNNEFTGKFIDALDGLTNLRGVGLSNNALTGTIPDLSWLTNLTYLSASGNKLTGMLSVMTGMTNLRLIALSNNALTGPFPDLSGLSDLQDFYASSNEFTGSLIDKIDGLTKLGYFYVQWNRLTGAVPDVSGLSRLKYFSASSNKFTGPITNQFYGLTDLTSVSLSINELTGAVPDFLTNPNLESLGLYGNAFNGELPPELFEMPSLEYLNLRQNDLTGTIPDNFGGSTSLKYIYLHDNLLTGTIPGITGDSLESIDTLYLHYNKMSGPVPDSICDLRSSKPDQFEYLAVDCAPRDNAQNPCPSGCCTYCTVGKGVDP